MSAPAPANDLSFSKDGKFLDGQVAASIHVTPSAIATGILLVNDPFPPGTTVVGSLSATVNGTPADVNFGSGKGKVTFSASAGASSLLAAYGSMADLTAALDPAGTILSGLKIDGGGATQFILLDWGYNIAATAKGSVALGAGASATFAAEGATSGLFAVIRGFATPPPSSDAVAATIAAWRLPSQISSADDLEPGTWVVAEVDGSVGVKLGAQYGYDFNWIRKVGLGNLSGDIGLKIQAAVEVAVGFDASGKYLVVVGRESADAVVRVQVFKMAKRGWTFAFDASVGVTGSTGTLLPDQIDGFVSAVFGVQGAQIVEDLKLFDKWTDPATPLPDLLSGFVADFATKELQHFAPTEIAIFGEARSRIQNYLQQWENLGHTAATALWSAVAKAGVPLADLQSILQQLSEAGDDAALRAVLETEFGKTTFGSSPFGQFVEAVAEQDVLGPLLDTPEAKALRTKLAAAANQVLDILNGKVLNDLIQFADQKLHIADVEKIVNEADFDNLDPWLKSKLAKFLGKDTVLFADLDQIRSTLHTIRSKASDLYAAALKALNNTYTAALHVTWAKTTTSTALLDVCFDFGKDPGVGAFLKMAIQGDFKDLMLASSPGILLKSAALTHGVKRQSHVQITLPYFSDTIDHLNDSLAKVTEDGSRLLMYSLNATDTIVRAHKWASHLTVTGAFSAAPGVRTYDAASDTAQSMTFSYGWRQASANMRDVQFETLVQPLVSPYFPKVFGPDADATAGSLHEWIGNLDHSASAVGNPGSGNLGTVLVSLDVALPGSVVAAWLKAPADGKDPVYFDLSRNIQRALRRFTRYAYFNGPQRYADFQVGAAPLVYSCLPVSSNIRQENGVLQKVDVDDDVYWDFEEQDSRHAMVFSISAQNALLTEATRIHDLLLDSGNLKKKAQFYVPSQLGQISNTALNDFRFHGLLFTEAQTISHAIAAAQQFAQFRASAGTDPEAAIVALEDFGAKLTDAFHNGLGGLVNGLEEFASMIFLEAARTFDATLDARPTARLDTILLRASAPATAADDFLAGTAPDPTAVALEQPVMGLP